jgi:hypothetical protein
MLNVGQFILNLTTFSIDWFIIVGQIRSIMFNMTTNCIIVIYNKKMTTTKIQIHYYKMWVEFMNPRSIDQWIHCFFTGHHSLEPVNLPKIQWNHCVQGHLWL